MKTFFIVLVACACFSSFANESIDQAAIEAYKYSNLAITHAPCTNATVKDPKTILLQTASDTFPLKYTVLVAQEFNCGFFSQSLLVKVNVSGEVDYLGHNFKKIVYDGDVGTATVVTIK